MENNGIKESNKKESMNSSKNFIKSFRNLPSLLLFKGFQLKSLDALIYEKNFMYMNISWDDLLRIIRKFTLGLYELGLKQGDNIFLISKLRYEARLIQYSILCSGGICIPTSPEIDIEKLNLLVSNHKPKLIFVENAELLEKYKSVFDKISNERMGESNLIIIRPYENSNTSGNYLSLDNLVERGNKFERYNNAGDIFNSKNRSNKNNRDKMIKSFNKFITKIQKEYDEPMPVLMDRYFDQFLKEVKAAADSSNDIFVEQILDIPTTSECVIFSKDKAINRYNHIQLLKSALQGNDPVNMHQYEMLFSVLEISSPLDYEIGVVLPCFTGTSQIFLKSSGENAAISNVIPELKSMPVEELNQSIDIVRLFQNKKPNIILGNLQVFNSIFKFLTFKFGELRNNENAEFTDKAKNSNGKRGLINNIRENALDWAYTFHTKTKSEINFADTLKNWLANSFYLSKVNDYLGGRIRCIISEDEISAQDSALNRLFRSLDYNLIDYSKSSNTLLTGGNQ